MDNSCFQEIARLRSITSQAYHGRKNALHELEESVPDARKFAFTSEVEAGLEKVLSRERIPVLIVGATSCGKSTFINEFLGKEVNIVNDDYCSARVVVYSYSTEMKVTLVDMTTGKRQSKQFSLDDFYNGDRMFQIIAKLTARPKRKDGTDYEILLREYMNVRVLVEGPFQNIPRGVEIYDTPGWGESRSVENSLKHVLQSYPLVIWLYNNSVLSLTEIGFYRFLVNSYPCSCGRDECSQEESSCERALPIFFLCTHCDRVQQHMHNDSKISALCDATTLFDDFYSEQTTESGCTTSVCSDEKPSGMECVDDDIDLELLCNDLDEEQVWNIKQRRDKYTQFKRSGLIHDRRLQFPSTVEQCPIFACISALDLKLDRKDYEDALKLDPSAVRRVNYHLLDFDKKFKQWVYKSEATQIMKALSFVAFSVGGILEKLTGMTEADVEHYEREYENMKRLNDELKDNVRDKILPLFRDLAVDISKEVCEHNVKLKLIAESRKINIGKYDEAVIQNASDEQEVREIFCQCFLALVNEKCKIHYDLFNESMKKKVTEAFNETFANNAALMSNELLCKAFNAQFTYVSGYDSMMSNQLVAGIGGGGSVVAIFAGMGYGAVYTAGAFVAAAAGMAVMGGLVAVGALAAVAKIFSPKQNHYDGTWKEQYATTICNAIESKKLINARVQADAAVVLYTKAFGECLRIAGEKFRAVKAEIRTQDNILRGQADTIALLGRVETVCLALQNEKFRKNIGEISQTPKSLNAFGGVFSYIDVTTGNPAIDTCVRIPHSASDSTPLEVNTALDFEIFKVFILSVALFLLSGIVQQASDQRL
jgi:hypothetical protein